MRFRPGCGATASHSTERDLDLWKGSGNGDAYGHDRDDEARLVAPNIAGHHVCSRGVDIRPRIRRDARRGET
jgi:hypothetical protein